MRAIIEAAGWPIWPLIITSILALGIIAERLWSLRQSLVAPKKLLAQVVVDFQQKGVNPETLNRLALGSPLGQIFACCSISTTSPSTLARKWR